MTLILPPVPRAQWYPRSQRAGCYDIEDRGYFRLQARTDDGALFWRGWFEERDEADRFIYALIRGELRWDAGLRRLPIGSQGLHLGWYGSFNRPLYEGEWHPDWQELPLTYEFVNQNFFTSSPGTLRTWTSPVDWDNNNNTIEVIGGGGSGGARTGGHPTGGGGGAYFTIANFFVAVPGTTTASFELGIGGAHVNSSAAGNPGGTTWFNSATDPGTGTDNTKCAAAGGSGGANGNGVQAGGPGGSTGWGQVSNNGGRGGNENGASGENASGGGGAAGGTGDGVNGGDTSVTSSGASTAGGDGDAGAGGNGGIVGGGNGSPGQEWNSTHGSGGGGGGHASGGGVPGITGGDGGLYGAGSGAAASSGGCSSGDAAQGILVVTWESFVSVAGMFVPEQPYKRRFKVIGY